MRTGPILSMAGCLLVAGCSPTPLPEPSTPAVSEAAQAERERLRQALDNIRAYLAELEGRLKISDAETWSHEASAAQHALGNIRIEMGTLRQGSLNLGNLESWVADLEGRLTGANAENWKQNAPAAQHIAGNLRIELQALSQGL
jgi:hypothetical protein